MNQAFQSPQTLDELLRETANLVSLGPPDTALASELDELRRTLHSSDVASAEVEQEILSLREVARHRAFRARTRTG